MANNRICSMFETVSELLTEAAECCDTDKAKGLIEKAQDLQEKAIEKLDGVCEDKEDKKDDTKKDEDDKDDVEKLEEAVELLLAQATLCESAEEACVYITKAEQCQKAIEDIEAAPNEEADDYNEDVNGGKVMPEDHLEDIKDLVDGSAEAVKILTVDEDSLTID